MHKMIYFLILVSLGLAQANTDFENYLIAQKTISHSRLHANISRNDTLRGVVVASPSKAEPNYYFHWVRDAALVMDLVRYQMTVATSSKEEALLRGKLYDYVTLVQRLQNTPNRSGGLGEPKFNVDGSAYDGDWGRPQNDGPAIRALTLARFANYLLERGEVDYVKHHLYGGLFPAQGVVKKDLEYVAHHCGNTDFDPWEEVRGHHFYNRMVQRKALVVGAQLAEKIGDQGAADFYRTQAVFLEDQILRHWDQHRKYFVVTIDRDGGADYKHSGIDAATILAINHVGSDDFLKLDDDRVILTAEAIVNAFKKLYPINNTGKAPGVVIGRYPEDIYNGNGVSEGNGWVLTTHGLGEYYYRLAQKLKLQSYVQVTDTSRSFYLSKLAMANSFVTSLNAQKYPAGTAEFEEIARALKVGGDLFLARVKYHTGADGAFAEQINRYTGFMQGAPDLTWSYASFLTALRERDGL